ncbi:MarR family winged helix-turn-helix transcriptional regulator [Zobellella maritima]|uniref:MarR family winged helix-turn-helix transcriptional regulator n=1 Tax=Zobellella maritima TaxID=2059725 RepID=UPI000E3058F2|nr:MarR family transcriptional regulator [Zobellella maritima]
MEKHEEILVALRQIIRAIDIHSRKLSKESGLTGPQLLLMQAIQDMGDITMRELAQSTNMSQATATTIIDRLEQKNLVRRVRSQTDKRKVHAVLTDEGVAKLKTAPRPLQESFIKRFQALDAWEQNLLLSSLQRVSTMMNASDLDVAPLLQVGSLLHE